MHEYTSSYTNVICISFQSFEQHNGGRRCFPPWQRYLKLLGDKMLCLLTFHNMVLEDDIRSDTIVLV